MPIFFSVEAFCSIGKKRDLILNLKWCLVTEWMSPMVWLNYRRMNGTLCCSGLKTGKYKIACVTFTSHDATPANCSLKQKLHPHILQPFLTVLICKCLQV